MEIAKGGIYLLIFLGTLSAWAGGSIAGNGGDVVYCENVATQPKIQLLDLFETKLFENKDPYLLFHTAGTAFEKATFLINTLLKYSPFRSQRYLEELSQFQNRIQFVNHELPNLPDDLNIVLPVGCALRQIVIQKKTNGIPSYLIHRQMWDELDENQKAALLIHEIVYSENIDGGHTDSRATRRLTRIIADGLKPDYSFKTTLISLNIYTYLEQKTDSGEYVLGTNQVKCGFKAKGRPLIQYYELCGPDKTGLNISLDGFGRIAKVIHPNGSILYEIHPSEIGLGEPVESYEISPKSTLQSFVPKNVFELKGFSEDVTCLPMAEVVVERIDKNPDLSSFDLSQSKFIRCELDQRAENKIFFFNQWRLVEKIEGSQNNLEISFLKSEAFEVSGTQFFSNHYSYKGFQYFDQANFLNVQLFTLKNKSFVCEAENSITVGRSADEVYFIMYANLVEPCIIQALGKNALSGTIKLMPNQNIDSLTLNQAAEVLVMSVMRPLPPYVSIFNSNEGYKVYQNKYYLWEPAKVHTPEGNPLWIKEKYELYENGTLKYGTLAKDVKLRVLDKGGACNVQRKSIKAETRIAYSVGCKAFYEF